MTRASWERVKDRIAAAIVAADWALTLWRMDREARRREAEEWRP